MLFRSMVRRPEQSKAPTVAGAQQRPNGLAPAEFHPRSLQQLPQILVRRVRVAQLELKRLAHPRQCSYRQGAPLGVDAHQVADKEVAPAELAPAPVPP